MYNNMFYQPLQKYEVIHVNGENGARSLQMQPNSNVLLLDDTQPVVWLAMTDGAGYKTVKAYDITPHVPEPQVNLNDILQRLEKVEARINESNTTSNEQ